MGKRAAHGGGSGGRGGGGGCHEDRLFPSVRETPMMRQHRQMKEQYKGALVLFRMGDFYEAFGEDAVKMSSVLDIALTRRASGGASDVDLAGFPYHALDSYLPRLVKAGLRVAICEQLEDPKQAKGLVKRGVTEVVTPGVAPLESLLDRRENQFLASVYREGNGRVGFSMVDVSTGEFYVAEGDGGYIERLVTHFGPKELLLCRSQACSFTDGAYAGLFVTPMEDWAYGAGDSEKRLLGHFGTSSLRGFGVEEYRVGIRAAGSILAYLDLTKHGDLGHIRAISRIEPDRYVWLDRFTLRNLEVFESSGRGGRTLVDVMDRTLTPMGGRLLRRWLSLPLKELDGILTRQAGVRSLVDEDGFREVLSGLLRGLGDLERLASRASMGRIIPREVVRLSSSLRSVGLVREACLGSSESSIVELGEQLNGCVSLCERIDRELVEDPPGLGKGQVIAEGVDSDLDEYRALARDSRLHLDKLREREAARTGISSLKVSFNNIYGYYFEVRNTYRDQVPAAWVRKQTLVSSERYINEELKGLEERILHASERIEELEQTLYSSLVERLVSFLATIQLNAQLIARLDVLLSYALLAVEKGWSCPEVDEGLSLEIGEGWHPVIAEGLSLNQEYVRNSVVMDPSREQLLMITGPNMSGKSALLRQTALIVLLAQCGSYVPAESARIGLVDKIFTRVGASDNISMGESTFMVEMTEAASILNNLSDRSLILLDEIGRGTSTYDGISIAWAMAEYIHDVYPCGPKTLFATHYHELNEMEDHYERIRNYHISVREVDDKVIFIRKLEPGGVSHSLGIHVAALAGMPSRVIQRAEALLTNLEQRGSRVSGVYDSGEEENAVTQIFQYEDPELKAIRVHLAGLDIDRLTPLEAINELHALKRKAGV